MSSLVTRRVIECMGTVISFDLRTPLPTEAVDRAEAALHDADRTFSTYRADSVISRLCRGELDVTGCPPDVIEVLARCRELEAATRGYFSAYPDGRLDPSGLVKGWAIQQASDLLVAAGSVRHCVNGGGDVQCVGDAGDGRPWQVGVAHPLRPGDLAAVAVGTGIAVATSGTAERGAHVLDPHTRRPPTGLASVTVAGPHLADVDAYATAAFAMGLDAVDWLTGLTDHPSLVVLADGRTWASPTWRSA
jgi:thiamine biosynthesis lipoprotein